MQELNEIASQISTCTACILSKTRTQTVPGSGDAKAEIMFVGEAPGFNEDQQGIPFVGQAGQLLNKMLTAINIQRKDVYITNVIPWRPPNNRPPTNEEILMCLPFLQKHIELIKPKFLLYD